MFGVSGCSDFIVFLLIHNPLVQEFIVGETLKRLALLRRTLLRNKLLPVLYFPTMVKMPMGYEILLRNVIAYGLMINCSF